MPSLPPVTLHGTHIRLEPLERHHVQALARASAIDPPLYQWSTVPQGEVAMARYVDTALAWRDAGTAVPFVIVRQRDNAVIGSTRFFELKHWAWPEGHPWQGRAAPDVCEIGYSWLTRDALRTAANTESKLLLLSHAFETWDVFSVCLHTDVRNERSRAAIERLGARFEGVLRAHRLAVDLTPRDSCRFAIVRSDWPIMCERLEARLQRGAGGNA